MGTGTKGTVPRGGASLGVLLTSIILALAGSARGQCNGRPLYLTATNSSGHLAFPEANWDAHMGAWNNFQFYPTAVKCTWVLRAPPAHVLSAAFLKFDTEQDYDFVTIYSSEARTEQLLRVSGDLTDEWFVTSPEDTLVVDFITDDYATYYGFLLAYRYEPQACVGDGVTVAEEHLIAVPPMNLDGVLPGPRQEKKPLTVIQPKGGAGGRLTKDPELGVKDWKTAISWLPRIPYGPWINCTWRVAVDSRKIVQLDILRFDTGVNDLMRIWQVGDEKLKPLFQYGGGDVPNRTFQSTKPLLVNFVSQAKDRGAGFLLNVFYIMRACEPGTQELTSPRGTVAYPRHNMQDGTWRTEEHVHYGPDSCEWVISAPEGYGVNVTILKFDTRPEDKLEMLEGTTVTFSHGGEIPSKRSFISRGSNLTLRFDSSEDTDKTGFLLQYSWVLRDCEAELKSPGGELRSPYYPDIYGSNVTCRWTLTPPAGHLLHVLVARLRLDAGDTLQVSDGQKDLKVTGIPHNAGRLLELRPSPSATLFFSSDQQHNRGYFLLKYTSFREGSCDFKISPCGWQSSDPLQAWAFHGSQGRMAVAEESGLGMQHPRGYRASLTSPRITPDTATPSPLRPAEGFPMCLRLDYLLDGPDAFLLTAAVTEEEEEFRGNGAATPLAFLPPLRNLLFLYGPHGNESITTAVNFTVSGAFRVSIVYERGYGPHYTVGLTGVQVTEGHCGGSLDSLTATTCSFTKDFCGWRNTHTDHRNWLLSDHGVVAEVRSGTVSTKPRLANPVSNRASTFQEQQWADLLSPLDVTPKDLAGGACLTLRYRILSENSELRVLLRPSSEGGAAGGGGGGAAGGFKKGERRGGGGGGGRGEGGHQEKGPDEILLWAQGRVRSPSVMEAVINLDGLELPRRYQLILRAVGVGGGGASGGVEVRSLTLDPGSCKIGPSCKFDSGFCSWKVSYTGGTVWYISPHEEEGEEGRHAAVLAEGNDEDTTSLTSEVVSSEEPVSLTFRYRVLGTSKCLSVGQREVGADETYPTSASQTNVIWMQCRGKGDHWLRECISLPSLDKEYKVVLTAGTGEPTSEVWVDDVQVVSASCNVSVSQTAPATSLATPPQWRCEPEGSLCGMTQPQLGRRDWVYVHVPPSDLDGNHTTRAPPQATTTTDTPYVEAPPTPAQRTCKDGTPLDAAWVCDGIPDCADESDEEDCECTDEDDLECAVTASSTFHLGAGVCAEGAFRCTSGRVCASGDCVAPLGPCLPRDLVCNGEADCYGAEDEAACVGVARTNPEHEKVGGIETMQCSGGLRIPEAWRCDGRKDCPLDGLDEVGCGYCGPDQFICPTSGVCVPSEQVCDGADSIPGCTDEQYCDSCPPTYLVCDVCVATWQICDGVKDCMDGEDERLCAGVRGSDNCDLGFYRCPSGRCLPEMSVCDRRVDCPDGDDETHCLDDNFDVSRYISVKPSVVGPQSSEPSRLLTPTLQHPSRGVGVLSFKYRLDAWLGASNATISVEVVQADNPSMGVQPWAVWRQSGHKGRHWLSTTVLVPPMEDMERYKIAFLVSHDNHTHQSQQLHLADLDFKVVLPEALNDVGSWLLRCEFEDSLCGWSQPTTEGDYSWVFARASPHARRTGPITGYPDGGHSGFLFADSLHGVEGSTADLFSPPLVLPGGSDPALCFRFAVFLFGAHVAKVSVHVLQRIGDGTHTAELFHVVGGKGLSWIPTGVTVVEDDLADPRAPLVLVVRATRGAGPEADIALDHVSVLRGACHRDPVLDTNVTLHAALAHPHALAFSAGPALTPAPKRHLPQAQESDQPAREDQGACEGLATCTECVSDAATTCSWCDMTQTCLSSTTREAKACLDHLTVHHNTSSQTRRGESWCPQLIPRQETEVLVAAGSSPVLSFAVQNIQVTQTDSGWICVFEPMDETRAKRREETEGEEEKREEERREGRGEIAEGGGDEEEEKESLERRLRAEEEEEEAKKKKKKAELKKLKRGWKEAKEGSLRLPGHFQGRVIDMGGGVSTGVGVGTIKCGDGITELRPHHAPSAPAPAHVHYAVRLITPAGALLDNPGGVKLVVYNCEVQANSCLDCMTVNASLSCGWCESSHTCTVHAHCLGSLWYGPGRSCESEPYLKIAEGRPRDESVLDDGLGGLDYEREEVKDDIDLGTLENLLDSPETENELTHEHDEEEARERRIKEERKKNKKKKKNPRRPGEDGGEEEEEEETHNEEEEEEEENMISDARPEKIGKLGGSKRSGKSKIKGQLKMGGRSRSFLRLPRHPGLYVARDAWRLHTGRQYYVPVTKKTLVNLGFVRQVTYGSLAEERTRTVLVNGAWKKAAGYFVDLFEKSGQDPVTSVITTSRSVFEQLLGQLLPTDP